MLFLLSPLCFVGFLENTQDLVLFFFIEQLSLFLSVSLCFSLFHRVFRKYTGSAGATFLAETASPVLYGAFWCHFCLSGPTGDPRARVIYTLTPGKSYRVIVYDSLYVMKGTRSFSTQYARGFLGV
jgi:hypothetical protein